MFDERNWQISISTTENELIGYTEADEKIYALGVDIGTTTVAVALIDMESGKIVDVASCYNSQIVYGDDVITRIIYTIENPAGLDTLRKSIAEDINALINTLMIRHRDDRIFLYSNLRQYNNVSCLLRTESKIHKRRTIHSPVINHYPIWRVSDTILVLE